MNNYYDYYDPSSKYTKIVAIPGRAEQSREFNEIQSMSREFLKRLSDVSLKEGSIVSGCELTIKDNIANITSGKIYLHGLIRDVEEGSVEINGTGNETIGVVLQSIMITESEDISLLDPAQNSENYGMPGAHRLQETLKLVANDPEATTIYKLLDGALLTIEAKPNVEVINDVLAVRTYDEMGNYKVNGLEIIKRDVANDTQIGIAVTEGKAYVKGYQITKPTLTNLYIDKSLAYTTVIAEPKIFSNTVSQYKLNNKPVKGINRVLAAIQATKDITKGTTSTDILPNTPVVDIVSIVQGTKTYVRGKDYQLINDSVNWLPTGEKPSIGSSYKVVWNYNKVLREVIDYNLIEKDSDFYIDFSPEGGDKPIPNSEVKIDYDFYLNRKDLVVLDKYGELHIIKGQPNLSSYVAVPSYNDIEYLCLGVITIYANSTKIDIDNNAICRMPLEKLWAMLSRIEDIEYNQAIADLDEVAQEGEQATVLKGILTDSFVNFDKSDTTHSLWNAAIDLTEKCVTTSFEDNSYLLTFRNTKGTSNFKAATYGYTITNPCTDTVILNQNNATTRIVINPYRVYLKNAILSISPSASNLKGTITYVNAPDARSITKNIVASSYYRGRYNTEIDRQNLLKEGYNNATLTVNNSGNNYHYNKTSASYLTGTKTTTSYKTRLITYIPTETVNVNVKNFLPYADNLTLTFAGVKCNFVPDNANYKGTQAGTCKADGNGVIKGKFTIPSNILSGTREVKITDGGELTATANFTCATQVIDTINTIQRKTIIYKPYDPLAQSFSFNTDKMVSKIGLYFASVDPNNNVTVEIRDMVNGYPGTTRLGIAVLSPSEIRTSGNASVETTVTFDDPVFCEADTQYCLIITTDSYVTSLYIANLGDKDLLTGRYVTTQADLGGVFFTSSNALTWTAEQSKDLKYKVYGKKFERTGVVTFDPIEINANRLCLNTDCLLPANCTCEWEYCINDNNVWSAITPFVDVYLDDIATKVQLRAKLTGTAYSSPILSTEIVRLDTYLNNISASYITKNVVTSQPFTTIKQVIDLNLPSGSSAVVQFATDGGGEETSWKNALQTGTPVDKALGYTQYTYITNLPEAATNFRARIKLISSKSSIIPKAKNLMNIIK